MTRTTWLVGGVVALLVGAGIAGILLPKPADGPRDPGADASPHQLATAVCGYVWTGFAAQIRGDESASTVLDDVDEANGLARRAAARDARWFALAGGMGALRQALTEDDPDAARVAIDVLTAECRDLA